MALSFKEVAEIMKIIDSSNCEELVLESEGTRLVVRRGSSSNPDTGASINLAGSATKQAPSTSAATEFCCPARSGGRRKRRRQRPRRGNREFTHGRHLLPTPISGRGAICRGRHEGFCWGPLVHDRSDETLYNHCSQCWRHRRGNPRRRCYASGI